MMPWIKKGASIILIIAVAAAAVGAAANLGLRQDPRVERLMNSPGAIERGSSRHPSDSGTSFRESDAPLVRVAKEFAAYLAPPPPPVSTPDPREGPKAVAAVLEVKPPVVSAKFELRGVSYNRSTPEDSVALIAQPGGNLVWVHQGAQLGHLIVEQIHGDSIVCRDGDDTLELALQIDGPAVEGLGSDVKVATNAASKVQAGKPSLVDAAKPAQIPATAAQPASFRPPAQVLTAQMIAAQRRRHARIPSQGGQ